MSILRSPPQPPVLLAPKRWPWLLASVAIACLTLFVVGVLHAREVDARRASAQATLFATELRDSIREISLFSNSVPAASREQLVLPVILATGTTAQRQIDALAPLVQDQRSTDLLRDQLQAIQLIASSGEPPALFTKGLLADANALAANADRIAAHENARARTIGRESIAGGAAAVLLALALTVMLLQRSQRLLVLAQRRQAIQLQVLADHDALTGLLNRRRLNEDLARIAPYVSAERPVQVVICDLDEFKTINDTRGHDAGDELLVRFADRIDRAAGARGVAYRLGGDEFLVLSHPGTEIATAVRAALDDPDEPVHGSAGVALWPREAPDSRTAMVLADRRMYEAKQAARAGAA